LKKGSSATTEEDAHAHVHNDSPSTYSIADFDTYSDNIAVCMKSSTSSPQKPATKLMVVPKTGGSSKKVDDSATVCEHVPPWSPPLFLPFQKEPTGRCCRRSKPETPLGASQNS
jgi:hypothetical protein